MSRPRDAGQAMARAFVDELVRCGVEHAVVCPGSRSAPMALALAQEPRIAVHVLVDERSAGFVALGLGKAMGKPACVLTTSGTAAANLYPAIIEARYSGVPLIALTADRPPELRDSGANQTIDQVKLFGDNVRWFCEVGVPENLPGSNAYWRSIACRAVAEAAIGGPVHINLAFREPLVPVDDGVAFDYEFEGRADGASWVEVHRPSATPSSAQVEELAAEVAGAKRPLLVAGIGRFDPTAVLALARTARLPLLAEAGSNARAGDAISMYDAMARSDAFVEEHQPDLVITVGRVGTSRALERLMGVQVRQISMGSDVWSDPARSMSVWVPSDATLVLDAVTKILPSVQSSAWFDSWLAAEGRARKAADSYLDSVLALSEPRTTRDLSSWLPSGSSLVVSSSMPVRDLDWTMRPREGVRVLGNRGANGIDGFVSTALGVAIGGGGPVIGLCGDLALQHDIGGLIAAARSGTDLIIVVANNDGGGIFSFLPQASHPEHFETLFGTPQGLDLGAIVAACGCAFDRVEAAVDLVPTLDRASSAGGIRVVEVPTDRSENVEVHQAMWDAVDRAL